MFGTLVLILLNDATTGTPDDPNVMRAPIGNNGTADILVGTSTITGDPEFTIDDDPVSNTVLAPGDQRIIKVRLDTDTPGTYTGYLNVPSSDRDGTLVIPLLGIVLGAVDIDPGIAVDPLSVAFGSVDTATGSATALITVSSTGTGDLTCGTTVVAGSGFSKSADGVTGAVIPPGGTRTVLLTFDPSSNGAKTGTLTIPSDAGASIVIALTGTGTTGAPPPADTLVTRFYLGRQPSGVAAIGGSPGAWANQTPDADNLLATSKAGPVVSLGSTVNHNGSPGASNRLGRWISPPLAAQTIDSTFLSYAIAYRSQYLGATVTSTVRFGIRHSDGSVTWGLNKAMSSASSAWPDSTAPGRRRFPAGTPSSWSTSPLLVLDGERLVVELGFRAFSSERSGARIRYGGASTDTDLEATEAIPPAVDLTKAPWIDFTTGILVKP